MNMVPSSRDDIEFSLPVAGHDILKYYHEDFIRIYPHAVKIDKSMIESTIEAIQDIYHTQKIKVFVDPSAVKGMSRDARKLLTSAIGGSASKLAILTTNMLTRTIASFILVHDNPSAQVKMFESESEAINWLEQ